MSNGTNKPIRSPSYPNMPLREAVEAVGKIEQLYRSSPVDRENAAKLIGYTALSGPANKALAALASYGLLERAGKGETRVTERARAILYANNDEERINNLLAAASDPPLFRELRERFEGIAIPPEDGVVTHLNRQGFNPTAIRPAAKAFLQTTSYLEELRATESHGLEAENGQELGSLTGDEPEVTYGGACVGDLIQWECEGVFQLPAPLRVRHVTDDGEWVFVEQSETGILMVEVVVQERSEDNAKQARTPPTFPLIQPDQASLNEEREIEWMRNQLGSDTNVRLMVKGNMGPKEIGKLITILNAQKEVLEEE